MREEKLPIPTVRASFRHRGFGGLVQAAVDEGPHTVLKLPLEGRGELPFVFCAAFLQQGAKFR